MKNNAFQLYRYITILLSEGIHFSEMLNSMGIRKINVYGMGEIGGILCNDIENVPGVEVVEKYDKKENISLSVLEDNDFPIVITPIGLFSEISKELIDAGIKRQRLISVAQILQIFLYCKKDLYTKFNFGVSKEFLIVGSNFDNKGSQAMTFSVIDKLRKKYGQGVLIWFYPNFWDEQYYNGQYRMIEIESEDLSDTILRATAVFDVSGYAISSSKGFGKTDRTITYLKKAYDYNIPYFLMPQSYGPLDFPRYKIAEMSELLAFAKIVYAREKEGKKLLESKLGLKNVIKSYDMVLLHDEYKKNNIYCETNRKCSADVECNEYVALVTNNNIIRFVGLEGALFIYQSIIDVLLENGEKVCLILHSRDNLLCEAIYEKNKRNQNVVFINNRLDCFDYSEIAEKCKFVIASRYHAIIHAYKQCKPSIIIGWAEKYKELSKTFEQEKYLLDVRSKLNVQTITDVVYSMTEKYMDEAKKIKSVLKGLNSDDIYERIWDIIDSE